VEQDQFGPAEHWILERCARTTDALEAAYANYEFGEAAGRIYDAIWSDYCDWYLELAKIGLGDESASPARKRAIWSVLTWVLDRYLRLLHPIMPMLTEEIWGRMPHLADDPDLLIVARWPAADDVSVAADTDTANGVQQLIDLISEIRAARAESGVAAADWLDARVWLSDGPAQSVFADMAAEFGRLARIRPTAAATREELVADAGGALAVIVPFGEARLMRSEADREREQGRLRKELAQILSQLTAAEARLSDDSFVTRAPANVVEGARIRVNELRTQAQALRERIGEE
jgi:valyl-tRNA synthetase